jgi:hypothetical protein
MNNAIKHILVMASVAPLLHPATQALCKLLRSAAWLRELEALAGYSPLDSGKVLRMTQVLPWWDF